MDCDAAVGMRGGGVSDSKVDVEDCITKANVRSPRKSRHGTSFLRQLQYMSGTERSRAVLNAEDWQSVRESFLFHVYKNLVMSFMFFADHADPDFCGILCLGTLANSYVIFYLLNPVMPFEVENIFRDARIAKISFNCQRNVQRMEQKNLLGPGQVKNFVSLASDVGRLSNWFNKIHIKKKLDGSNEVYFPAQYHQRWMEGEVDHVALDSGLDKFIFLCTGLDAYKTVVRMRCFFKDLRERRGNAYPFATFLAEEYHGLLVDYSYCNQTAFLIFYHDAIIDNCPKMKNFCDFVNAAGFFLRN